MTNLAISLVLLALALICGWKCLKHYLQYLLRRSIPAHYAHSRNSDRPLRVAVVAVGSTGDMHVYTSLAMEFKQRGHTVALLAEESFRSLAIDAGLEWLPLQHASVKSNMAAKFDADFVHAGNVYRLRFIVLIKIHRFCVNLAGDPLWTVLRKYWRSYKFDAHNTRSLLNSAADHCFAFRPELIVFGTFSCAFRLFVRFSVDFTCFRTAGAYDIAEALRVPAVMVYLAPKTPTSEFPMHLLQLSTTNTSNTRTVLARLVAQVASLPLLRPWLNRASYFVNDFVSWHPLRAVFDEFRQERLGLRALPWWIGPRERAHAAKMLTVYSFSQQYARSSCILAPFHCGLQFDSSSA